VPLFDREALSKVKPHKGQTPVAVLLDYIDESPPASTARALKESIAFASRKVDVIFMFRFMRTAADECEGLYSEARNMGVTFIKYERLEISFDEVYTIEVSDGINDVCFSTGYLVTDSGYGVSGKFETLVKKLRLMQDGAGLINEDRYYLGSTLTGRKGVFFLSRDICEGGWDEAVDYAVSAVRTTASGIIPPRHSYAEVDGEKCVFCYTCYRTCPHGAMEPDGENRVMKNKNAGCDGCGICASICPGNAVTMTDDDFIARARANHPDRIKVFSCENSAGLALRGVLAGFGNNAEKIEYEEMACGGRVGFEQMSSALLIYRKVVVAVCMDGACKHFEGNKRACQHGVRLSEMLEKAGLDPGRVILIKTSHALENVFRDEIMEAIK
jgi:Pyruvate/2-oxoacid:ferredoxin oxidoreductase delta subunit/coenzyme F420-reducing hydrogenase delta subunit